MAIAYYIPDQAKLLAGRHPNRQAVTNNRNSNTAPNDAQQSARDSETASNPAVNRGYGTNINLTVPTYATQQEPAGCWDFLTQVFCHALRFYHESSQLQPTVVQISVNFQSQTAESQTTAATATSTAVENTTNNGNSPTATTTTATTATDNADSINNNTEDTASTATTVADTPTAQPSEKEEKPLKHKKSGKREN